MISAEGVAKPFTETIRAGQKERSIGRIHHSVSSHFLFDPPCCRVRPRLSRGLDIAVRDQTSRTPAPNRFAVLARPSDRALLARLEQPMGRIAHAPIRRKADPAATSLAARPR